MIILGVSGLARSVSFKKEHWPCLDEREYRISQGHDSAAAIIADGAIIAAAEEERFDRRKHSNAFPERAIAYCLEQAGVSIDDVDEVAHCYDYSRYRRIFAIDPVSRSLYDDVFSKQSLLAEFSRRYPRFPLSRIHQIGHHLCHAASAYFTSGWDDCLAVVVDAMGETQGISAYTAHGGVLSKIGEVSANNSIGILYSLVTLHLGFDFNSDEYKIMGLAPYGDPSKYGPIFGRIVQLVPDGTIRIPILGLNHSRDERENYLATRAWLSANLLPERNPRDSITQDHCDAAAALQACLDRTMLHICERFGEKAKYRRLAIAGGVGLNCTANGRLMRSGCFDDIYIQPAAGDDGAALGAALYCSSLAGETRNVRMPPPFLGPGASKAEVEGAIRNFQDQLTVAYFETLEDACEQAARLIARGDVIAWCRGPMEFGPRALGNRSILADPGGPEMRDRINALVKKREAFRPFAPAVSLEQVDRWFELPPGTSLPYMITVVDVRPEYRAQLPAITHVDGSARVQTVSTDDNPAFHLLLQAVGRATGREMVLNTSFNVKGQPIVNTSYEAIETYLSTGIDYLFLENALITRREKVSAN